MDRGSELKNLMLHKTMAKLSNSKFELTFVNHQALVAQ